MKHRFHIKVIKRKKNEWKRTEENKLSSNVCLMYDHTQHHCSEQNEMNLMRTHVNTRNRNYFRRIQLKFETKAINSHTRGKNGLNKTE